MKKIEGVEILAGEHADRLGVISFTIEGLHYNLVSKLLNDHYGIQTRGGCACAGTYGHYLFRINKKISRKITNRLDRGDYSTKPGFVRLSIHPILSNQEIRFILQAIAQVSEKGRIWAKDYKYNPKTNEFMHKSLEEQSSILESIRF